MGLSRSPDRIRLSSDDPVPSFLESKVLEGQGIRITRREDAENGHQAVISAIDNQQGSFGDVVVLRASGEIPKNASLVLVDSSLGPIDVMFPHPAEVLHWFSIVCVNKSNSINFHTPNESAELVEAEDGQMFDCRTGIFDRSNIEFQAAGDSLVFASDRSTMWYCVAKYSADWYG